MLYETADEPGNRKYRPIEGYTKSTYGETGDFIELKDYGEVRITLEETNTEDKLQELLND